MKEKVKKEEEVIDEQDDSQVYELGYHLLPTVPEADLVKEVAQIHAIISECGGAIISESAPLMRQLAYEISKKIETKSIKFNRSFFGWVKFEMTALELMTFKIKIEKLPNILRSIIIKTVKENTLYSPKVSFKKEVVKNDVHLDEVEKTPVSEEEIDKSIDDLLVTETRLNEFGQD